MSSQSTKALKRPDPFMTWVKSSFDSIMTHGKEWLSILAVFLVLGGGYAYWSTHKHSKLKAASDALYTAQKTYEAEMRTVSSGLQPDAEAKKVAEKNKAQADRILEASRLEASRTVSFSVSEKLPKAVAQYQSIAQQFPGTSAAFDANLMLGDLFYAHETSEKAIPWYEKAVSDAPDSFSKGLALSSLGYSYENSKKYTEAAQAFEKILNLGELTLKPDALFSLARSQIALGQKDLAKGTYDRIIGEFVGTNHAKLAEVYKSNL